MKFRVLISLLVFVSMALLPVANSFSQANNGKNNGSASGGYNAGNNGGGNGNTGTGNPR